MALGVIYLVVGLAVLVLFVARLWDTLPPDLLYRQRLVRWLAALAVGAMLYTLWMVRSARSRPKLPPYPDARYRSP